MLPGVTVRSVGGQSVEEDVEVASPLVFVGGQPDGVLVGQDRGRQKSHVLPGDVLTHRAGLLRPGDHGLEQFAKLAQPRLEFGWRGAPARR